MKMTVHRTLGATVRGIPKTVGAAFALFLLFACGSDDVKKLDAAGGASSSGGSATATGGAASSTGGTAAGSGGVLPGSGGTTSSGGTPPNTGGSTASNGGSGGGPDAGTSDPDASAPRPHAATLGLATTVDDPKVPPYFKVYRPTDLASAVATTGRALPVIVWANGGCFRVAVAWEVLYKRWAAAGFVVLALDAGPDGNLFAQTSVEDQGKLIDWTLAEASKAGGTYAGKLDTSSIVAAGNSCGGVTALGVAAKDDRVKSVFVLSGSSALAATNAQIMGAIRAPIGYIVGGSEDIAAPNATADYAVMAAGVPGMMVNRSTGDHVLVSTDAAILSQVAGIALDWMDLCLYGTPQAYAALTSPTVCPQCDAGTWTLKSKNLESLRR